MDVSELIERFRTAAIAKGDGTAGNSDAELYSRMRSAYGELVRRGDRGNLAFEALVADPSPHVRSWVATQLLFLGHSSVRPVLEELASQPNMLAFSVSIALQEYDAGRLKSPL
jgi:hypothetical protein